MKIAGGALMIDAKINAKYLFAGVNIINATVGGACRWDNTISL